MNNPYSNNSMSQPNKHLLSKSTFIRGLQCYKSLYLYKNYYHLRDKISPELQAVFNRGTNVGELARKLFPGGIDVSPPSHFKYNESIVRTDELIKSGQEIIYEASFQTEQVLVAIDILAKRNGKWHAVEVKSSTRVSDTYLMDAAIQYYVITNSGLELEDMSIAVINNQYVLGDQLDINKLFSIVSVKKQVQQLQPMIFEAINNLKNVIFSQNIPEIEIGGHCFKPYACDFMSYCWGSVRESSIFDISGMSKEKQFELYHKGYHETSEIGDNENLPRLQQIQVDGKPIIKKDKIKLFLDKLKFPLLFLDFETVQYAVPKYKGTNPYQQIPFQFSLHILDKNNELQHHEFLAEPGTDPRKDFAANLIGLTRGEGTILAYNAAFENMILNYLIKWFPEVKQEVNQRKKRLTDLMLPFQNKDFYLPEMKGSHSIKSVLPALFPGLKYDVLQIQNGHMATSAYENLQHETDMFAALETKNNLLEYCKMDTLAMVKIYEKLVENER